MLLATTRLVNEYVRRNPGTLVLAAHDPAAASTVHDALRARTV
jgi:N-acyl homoserine lactone hydrolase